MRVICKPNVEQQLDALIDKVKREGKEIDYIELTRIEYDRLKSIVGSYGPLELDQLGQVSPYLPVTAAMK